MRARPLLVPTVILALTTALGAAAPAGAAPSWVAPVTVAGPSPESLGDLVLDVNASGRALLAWSVTTGGIDTVRVAGRAPGAAVDASRSLSENEGVAGTRANGPAAALADDGTGLVAWQAKNGAEWTVHYRTVSAAGALGPVRSVGDPVDTVFGLSIDVSRAGQVAIAWRGETSLWGAVGTTTTGLGPAEELQSGGNLFSPEPGVDDQGNVVFAWEHYFPTPNEHSQVETRVKPAGQVLGPVVPIEGLAVGNFAQVPKVAVAPGGTATVVYGYVAGSNDPRVRYAVRSVTGSFAGAGWGSSGWASADGVATTVDGHDVVELPDGGAVATYVAGGSSVMATAKTATGAFGGHQPISPPGDVARTALASGPTGVVAAAWSDGGVDAVAAALRPAAGSTFGAVDLDLDSEPFGNVSDPVLDVDDQGNVYEAHVRSTCTVAQSPCVSGYERTVRFTAYDAAAPVLGPTSLPAYAAAKRPADFVALAEDRVGPVRFGWAFGDGGVGQGATVPHVYNKKGSYPAALTASDAAGNTASQTRTVTVLAPALKVKLKAKFATGGKRTVAKALTLKKLLPGSKVIVTCKGRGCPFDTDKVTAIGKRLALASLLGGAGLKNLVRLEVEVRSPRPKKATGRYFSFVVQDGAKPLASDGCLTPKGQPFGC